MVEKVRTGSLQPGTTVHPILKDHPLVTSNHYIPLLDFSGFEVLGWVCQVGGKDFLKTCRFISYKKADGIKRFQFKKPTMEALQSLENELVKRGIDCSERISVKIADDYALVPITISQLLGLQVYRICLIAYTGRMSLNLSLLMARRSATAIKDPSTLHCILSEELTGVMATREQVAHLAYKQLDLQPLFYSKLQSLGIFPVLFEVENGKGLVRQAVHLYGLDVSESPSWKPRSTSEVISGFEMISIKNLLDACHAGLVRKIDAYCILQWCLVNGVINPENDEQFAQICQVLRFDFPQMLVSLLYK